MRLFPAPPEIDEQTGFDQGDLFGRKEFGDRLTRLVLALEHPAVLLLDAPWGAGKTIFVKMWEGELRKQSVPVIHFDAFASDYMADPFTALAGEVLDLAKENEGDESKVDAFRKKALGVVKILARHGLRIGIRVATQGLVDIGDTTDAKADEKAIVDGVTDAADALLLKRLEDHAAERETFAAFREALKELSISLGPAGLPEGERRPPLVFVIDELDRCRPTFALSLLETVKHFFDVDGVVFLLVTNLAQLEKSVEFAYGVGIDARGYLEKFFHLRAVLPAKDHIRSTGDVSTYVRHLSGSMGLQNPYLGNAIIRLADKRSLGFRSIERIMTNLMLYAASNRHDVSQFAQLVVGLCFMKINDPELYAKARQGMLTWPDVVKWGVSENVSPDNDRISYLESLEWRYCCGGPLEANQLANDLSYIANRETALSNFCRQIDAFALPVQVR